MIKLAIRDDDMNYFTKVEDLEKVYVGFNNFPISYAVVPYVLDVSTRGACPDTKGNEYEGIDSKILLRRVMGMLRKEGYELGNCDITICAQAPKLNPYIDQMQACLAEVMGVTPNQVSLKATTTEHLGFVGREEGIAAYAVALIQ